MRLLQIDPNGSETTALDLHPMITVVTGLTPSGRDLVLRVARSLGAGSDPGLGGLVEAHGVLLDLNRETLDLLDLRVPNVPLVNDSDLPTGPALVDDDLSSLPPPPGGDQSRSKEVVESFIANAPVGVHGALDAARQRQRDAREALGILREAADKAHVEFDKVLARKKVAEAELAAAREATGPTLRLVADEADEAAEPKIDRNELIRRREELAVKIEGLEEKVTTANRGLEELSGIDTRPLQVLLDAIRNPPPVEMVPSERAHQLADEVVDLERKVNDLEKELDRRGLASGPALKQLESARIDLLEAEKTMKKPELTPEDVIELEAAHEAVFEAQKKKRGGQRRLDEAVALQQEILDRVGFPTWTAYVMGAGLLAIDHAAEQRLEKARLDMEAAESHWAAVCAEIEANPEHRRLLDRLEAVYLVAFDLLDGEEPDDLESALRGVEEPKREVSPDELIEALVYQLELVGLELPPAATDDLVIMASEAFIEEASAVEGRSDELRDEKFTAEAELSVARVQHDELSAIELPPEGADGDESYQPEPIDVPTEIDVEPLERAVEGADEEVGEYTEWLESREALVDAALTVETVATSRLNKLSNELLDEVEADAAAVAGNGSAAPRSGPPEPADVVEYFTDRLDSQRHVSFAGSLPLIINDALHELDSSQTRDILGDLQTLSESVQVVYLSDDPTIVGWAEDAGFQRAAVVPAPLGFG
jgi:hypothetical protein